MAGARTGTETSAERPRTADGGLSAAEVAERVARGEANVGGQRTSRTLGEIAKANIFTRFNAILGAMFVVIVVVGEWQDSLFGIILVVNALIGIVQEWRSKRTLDRLAVLNAPRAHVIRDGASRDLAVEEVVLDDLLELRTGDQIPADGVVHAADGLEVDESLLTGESDPVAKDVDDPVMSGSIVVAGNGCVQATAVGEHAYARRLATEARRFTTVDSELQRGTNQILKWVTWALVPAVALLGFSQFRAHSNWRTALQGVVAGVVAMVPQGLVLLTSLAFAIAAVTLARRQVLVQELPAVEGLARVDVVCVDKTGTITAGAIAYDAIDYVGSETGAPDNEVTGALGALGADPHANATALALAETFPAPNGWDRTAAVPFSSARKWSAMTFAQQGTWVFGAPEMVLPDASADDPIRARANELAAEGRRVLVLARSEQACGAEALPAALEPRALVQFTEQVRPDARETFAYFTQQGVQLRVISGDNPQTVGAVAARAGIPGADKVFDARELPDDLDAVGEILESHFVFGRVTPQQKRAMVQALQRKGHVVAMTGDGVNDALALKDADIGVAMGNGAAATRAVAQIVLLDSKFATMPGVVAEGRRVIANVERVSNLYITKTVFATIIACVVGLAQWPYPLLPRHLTVVDTLAIGVPSFFLALAPNSRRYEPGFVRRVLGFTLPAGGIVAACLMTTYGIVRYGLPEGETVRVAHESLDAATLYARSFATLVLLVLALWVLALLARPFTRTRVILVALMVAAFVGVLTIPPLRDFYQLNLPADGAAWATAIVAAVVGVVALETWFRRRGQHSVSSSIRPSPGGRSGSSAVPTTPSAAPR